MLEKINVYINPKSLQIVTDKKTISALNLNIHLDHIHFIDDQLPIKFIDKDDNEIIDVYNIPGIYDYFTDPELYYELRLFVPTDIRITTKTIWGKYHDYLTIKYLIDIDDIVIQRSAKDNKFYCNNELCVIQYKKDQTLPEGLADSYL